MRYTYSDDEDGSDGLSSRRSTRISTPLEAGPTVTASGRQVKSRLGGMYGESMLVDQRKEMERTAEGHVTETSEDMPASAPTRAIRTSRSGRPVHAVRDQYANRTGSESDEAQSSGKEWSGDEDELEPEESEPDFDAGDEDDEDDEMSDPGLERDELGEDDNTQESLVVQLRYRKGKEPERPPTQPLPPIVNGVSIKGTTQSSDALKPLQQPSGITVMDTIEVIPRAKAANGTPGIQNGVENQEHHVPPSPQSQLRSPLQPMDLS
jgi:hypothetical protein